jgi:hypothetical protein
LAIRILNGFGKVIIKKVIIHFEKMGKNRQLLIINHSISWNWGFLILQLRIWQLFLDHPEEKVRAMLHAPLTVLRVPALD